MIEGSPRVTLFDEDVREIEVCRGELRLQLERLLIAGNGLVDTLLFAERRSEIVVRGGVIRLGRYGEAVVCDRLIDPMSALQRSAGIRRSDGAHCARRSHRPV